MGSEYSRLVQLSDRWSLDSRAYQLTAVDLQIDLSRSGLDSEIEQLFLQTLQNQQFPEKIEDMFRGNIVNQSEQRPALHTALRAPEHINKQNLNSEHAHELNSHKAQLKQWGEAGIRGIEQRLGLKTPITDILCLGIGGSSLGTNLLHEVAGAQTSKHNQSGHQPVELHFISNRDDLSIYQLLSELDPHATLVFAASKSMSSPEIIDNLKIVSNWLANHLSQEADLPIIGCTANADAAKTIDIPESQILHLPQSIGGRYSLWSGISLPIALKYGWSYIEQLHAGAHAIDCYFRDTPLDDNAIVQSTCADYWHFDIRQVPHRVVLPYCSALGQLLPHLQQLEMESLGKAVNNKGEKIAKPFCPAVWGQVGSEVEHACGQWLHQHAANAVVEFIATVQPQSDNHRESHRNLLLQMLAQSQVLAVGTNSDTPHSTCQGQTPSSLICLPDLSAYSLGQLLAYYEHRVYVNACLHDINPFDQWGVEHSKKVSKHLTAGAIAENIDGVTIEQITRLNLYV